MQSPNNFSCPRCKQVLASRAGVVGHLARKYPCLMVDLPPEHALAEQKAAGLGRPKNHKAASIDPASIRYSSDVNLALDDKTGNTTLILGSSKSGKSTLLMYLYKKYYKESVSILFTESPQIKLYNQDKSLIIGDAFYPEVVRAAHSINKGTGNKYPFMFMLDDVVDEKESTTLKKMVLVLRNSNISTMVSLQDPKLFAKGSRGNVNNIILFRYNTSEAVEGVIRTFLMAKLPGTMEQKIRLYQQITDNHGFMYYDPRRDFLSCHRLAL